MSKGEEIPELDINDDDDEGADKSNFEKPSALKKGSEKRSQLAGEGEKPKTEGDDKKPAEGQTEPAAEGEPPAKEGQPPAEDGQPPAEDGKPPAEDGQPPAEDGKPPAEDGQPPAEDGQPPAEDGQPPATEGQPPATEGQPPADEAGSGGTQAVGAPRDGEEEGDDDEDVDEAAVPPRRQSPDEVSDEASEADEGAIAKDAPDEQGAPTGSPSKEAAEGDEEAEGSSAVVKRLQEQMIEEVVSGKAKGKTKGKSDLSVPEKIIQEVLPEGGAEEEMSPEDIGHSIVTEMVTGKKPRRAGASPKGVAEGVVEDAVFGDSPEAVAGHLVGEIVPSPQKIAGKVVSDIISPEYHAKKIMDELMPGRDETAEGIAEKMASLMVPGDDGEEVTQYIWEGPCSSSSGTSGKSGDDMSRFDRENYIERYKNLYKEKFITGRKNIFLQKKVYDYYKRKMLIRYFESIEDDQKAEAKYIKDLKEFEEFINGDRKRRAIINMQLVELEKQKQESDIRMSESLNFLIETEREHGADLVNERTGKMLLDKTVERLLRRQKETVKELVAILQKYIRIRDFLTSKEKALIDLETIGVDCYLRDYEQLQMENQSYSDKIEERDEELMRLRQDATASMQILAHVREKANATTNSIYALHESLESVVMNASEIREHIVSIKKIREQLREETQQMKINAGLLVQHRLVRDFQDSILESIKLDHEIQQLRSMFTDREHTLTNIRLSLSDRRRSSQSHLQRQRDYQIFKDLLHYKRRDMPADDDGQEREAGGSVAVELMGEGEDEYGEGGDERPTNLMPTFRKGRPNFFPVKKFNFGSYIK